MKERKFKIEGSIGIVDEEFMKQEYEREKEEFSDCYIPPFEEWLEDLLLDSRSAITEVKMSDELLEE